MSQLQKFAGLILPLFAGRSWKTNPAEQRFSLLRTCRERDMLRIFLVPDGPTIHELLWPTMYMYRQKTDKKAHDPSISANENDQKINTPHPRTGLINCIASFTRTRTIPHYLSSRSWRTAARPSALLLLPSPLLRRPRRPDRLCHAQSLAHHLVPLFPKPRFEMG